MSTKQSISALSLYEQSPPPCTLKARLGNWETHNCAYLCNRTGRTLYISYEEYITFAVCMTVCPNNLIIQFDNQRFSFPFIDKMKPCCHFNSVVVIQEMYPHLCLMRRELAETSQKLVF